MVVRQVDPSPTIAQGVLNRLDQLILQYRSGFGEMFWLGWGPVPTTNVVRPCAHTPPGGEYWSFGPPSNHLPSGGPAMASRRRSTAADLMTPTLWEH